MSEQDSSEEPHTGEVSDEEIAQRAQEIARSRGRDEPAEADWATALARLGVTKEKPAAPELADPGMGEIVEWDESPASDGHEVPATELEDESTVEAEFVEEGLEEAERDLRATQKGEEE